MLNQSNDLVLYYFICTLKEKDTHTQKKKTLTNYYLQTFSELRHIVVRWFAQMDEEI